MKTTNFTNGFTVIEMLVVIGILGILASLTAFGFRGWQDGIDQRQIQSDLRIAAASMEAAKNFGSGYPLELPGTFESGGGVTVTFEWGNVTRYCLQAISVKTISVIYYVNSSEGTNPQPGSCPASPVITPPASNAPQQLAATVFSCSKDTMYGYYAMQMKFTWNAPSTGGTVTGYEIHASWYTDGGSGIDFARGSTNGTTYTVTTPERADSLPQTFSYKMHAVRSGVLSTDSNVASVTANGSNCLPAPASIAASHWSTANGGFGYDVTATGGSCTSGTTQWKFSFPLRGSPPSVGYDKPWQSSSRYVFSQTPDGSQTVRDVYAIARCSDGTEGHESGSYVKSTDKGTPV